VSAFRFVVEGRVQGVAYRAFTRDAATGLGLTGWVRNREDGTVEVEVAGSDEGLARLAERLRQGPPLARVTALKQESLDRHPEWTDFRILYQRPS